MSKNEDEDDNYNKDTESLEKAKSIFDRTNEEKEQEEESEPGTDVGSRTKEESESMNQKSKDDKKRSIENADQEEWKKTTVRVSKNTLTETKVFMTKLSTNHDSIRKKDVYEEIFKLANDNKKELKKRLGVN